MKPTSRINISIKFRSHKYDADSEGVCHEEPFFKANGRHSMVPIEVYQAIESEFVAFVERVDALKKAAEQEKPKGA